MLRILIAALLLLLAGAALFFIFDFEFGWVLPFLALFTRRMGLRILSKLLLMPLIYMVLPERWRHRVDEWLVALKEGTKRICAWCVSLWRFAPWWLRFAMLLAGAIVAGLLAFICLVFPVRVQRLPIFGEVLRQKIIPWLMHRSALSGIEREMPEIVRRLPEGFRRTAGRRYRLLWWWTARHLVRTRQALGRKMLEKKHARDRNAFAASERIFPQRVMP